MSLLHLLILAIVQGITEFLPISSSAHLILLPALTGIEDQGIAIDVAVHVGTLFAVVAYFWVDVKIALRGTRDILCGRLYTPDARLALLLALATIPVVIAGLLLKLSGQAHLLRSVAVIGWATLIFGIALYWTDQRGQTDKKAIEWSVRGAVLMGLAQMIALIPGTSRSGITITAARYLGFARKDAARLSMLMSIPTILASGVLLTGDLIGQANWDLARDASIAAVFAFAAALLALSLMMRLLKSVSFTPYVVYRVILGLSLLAIAYA